MSSELANILFKEYRRRVLGLLILRPDKAYHVREIARLTDTVPGTLHKELSKLASVGVLSKTQIGNQVSYQANINCVIFEELASILRKTSGLADVLANLLAPLAYQIDVAVVFGSMASGKANQNSDIDLLIIGNITFGDIVKTIYPAQEILGREINPKIYTPLEWRSAKNEGSAFINELLTKPVINIIGGKDDLGKPVGASA